MRKLGTLLLTCLVVTGCSHLTTLTVSTTLSPTLHLDGIGRGPDPGIQAKVEVTPGHAKKK